MLSAAVRAFWAWLVPRFAQHPAPLAGLPVAVDWPDSAFAGCSQPWPECFPAFQSHWGWGCCAVLHAQQCQPDPAWAALVEALPAQWPMGRIHCGPVLRSQSLGTGSPDFAGVQAAAVDLVAAGRTAGRAD